VGQTGQDCSQIGMAVDRDFLNCTHCSAVSFPALLCSKRGEIFTSEVGEVPALPGAVMPTPGGV